MTTMDKLTSIGFVAPGSNRERGAVFMSGEIRSGRGVPARSFFAVVPTFKMRQEGIYDV